MTNVIEILKKTGALVTNDHFVGVSGLHFDTYINKDALFFTRGYDAYVKDKRVLIVEDNVTTGGSVMKVVRAVEQAGGNIVGVCVMVNRSPDTVNATTLGVPLQALSEFNVPTFEASVCPLCKSGVPINTKVGHGKKFLEAQTK